MKIDALSQTYQIKQMTEDDLCDMYELCLGNPLYYHYCPPPVTIHSLKDDLSALPPGKTQEDKYFLGFYQQRELIAILDLITGYPDSNTAFIGFFMMHQNHQKTGKGSALIEEICSALKNEFTAVRLGYVKGNPQARHFWLKNQFVSTGIISHTEHYDIIVMQRTLKGENTCLQK